MKDEAGGLAQPVSLTELRALRTDFQDVPVPQLGGHIIRMWALTGSQRAQLMAEITTLSKLDPSGEDPEVLRKVLLFQGRVVGASMGLPEGEWDQLGETVGSGAVEELYSVTAQLSGLNAEAKDEAVQRLPSKRSAASGTD